jgi:hypothetical protein
MNLLTIVIIAFMFLEFANVVALYIRKDSKMFNSVGVFTAWEKAKQDPEMHNFTSYLINWVAGTKLIFLSMLTVILIFGDEQIQVWVLLALIISIMSFYWKLYPLAKKMDREGQLDPKNYSRTLGVMISVFVIVFLMVFVWTFIQLF